MSRSEFAYSRQKTLGNARAFLVGKILSAVTTVAWLGVAVRSLNLQGYADYVSAVAAMETGIVLSAAGMDWMVLRYVPEFVVQSGRRELGRFMLKALVARTIAAIVVVAVGAAMMTLGGNLAPNALREHAPWIAVLIISESCMRLLRDNAMESLGEQRLTQAGVILRTASLIGLVWSASAMTGQQSARSVLLLELAASVGTLIYAVWALRRGLRKMPDAPTRSVLGSDNWQPPTISAAFRMGWNNYISTLVSYPLSMQAMTLLVSIYAGTATVATFGFVGRLFDITRGYVPALMLMSVLRPRFIGMYALNKDFGKLASEAALASRISALTVAPLIGMILLYGDRIIEQLSGGHITAGHLALAALVSTLLFRVHRQISVVLVNCVEQSRILLPTASLGLLGWPLAWYAITLGHPLLGACLAVLWDEMAWVLTISHYLNQKNYQWSTGVVGLILTALAAVFSACVVLSTGLTGAGIFEAVGCALMVVTFALATRILGIWRRDDLRLLNKLIKR